MVDLCEVIKRYYYNPHTQGSNSIKKVLPVICSEFSYSNLDIQDGTMALDTWGRLVTDPNFNEDKNKTRKNLLLYCELDTLAMVEIFKVLKAII